MPFRFPVARPDIGPREKQYVAEAMEAEEISSQGSFVRRFEEAFAAFVGTRHAVACSSGTSALILALAALEIGRHPCGDCSQCESRREGLCLNPTIDEVIVPDFTMIATAVAVSKLGAKPVFVDCGTDLNVNPLRIESAITSKTRAIIPVHIYGRPCKMDRIMSIARRHNLHVVEDAAEAHGATFGGRKVGSFGIAGCFSLYANKIITAGEGGVVATNDDDVAEEMRKIRSLYFSEGHSFVHPKLGYNFRMTNLQAAIALAQTERIDDILEKRERIRGWYDEAFAATWNGKKFVSSRPEGSVLWMYDIVTYGTDRDALMEKLAKLGIETRRFFQPMTHQPPYAVDASGAVPHTTAGNFAAAGLYLPTYNSLSQENVREIVRKVVDNV